MKQSKLRLIISYILLAMMSMTIIADFVIYFMLRSVFLQLGSFYTFSDIPFLVAFSIYIIYILIRHKSGKIAFIISTILLLMTGLMYIFTGPGVFTERLSVWFYLFFLAGIIKYSIEAWHK